MQVELFSIKMQHNCCLSDLLLLIIKHAWKIEANSYSSFRRELRLLCPHMLQWVSPATHHPAHHTWDEGPFFMLPLHSAYISMTVLLTLHSDGLFESLSLCCTPSFWKARALSYLSLQTYHSASISTPLCSFYCII